MVAAFKRPGSEDLHSTQSRIPEGTETRARGTRDALGEVYMNQPKCVCN